MAGNYPDYADLGVYLQTTFTYDVQKLESLDVNSKEFKELLVRMYQSINKIAISLNNKQSGYYPLTEFVSGGQFFPITTSSATGAVNQRQEYVKTFNFGVLPNSTIKAIPHGITINTPNDNITFTHIYATGTTSNPVTPIGPAGIYGNLVGWPIPYVYPHPSEIALYITTTHVVIETFSDYTNTDRCIVVLKYLKTI